MKKSMLLLLAMIAGCSGGAKTDYLQEANEAFLQGDYTMALDHFIKLAATDTLAGFSGAGWSALRLHSYEASVSYFQSVSGYQSPDVHAGLGIVYWALGDFNSSISHANLALTLAPDYSFFLDPDINSLDLTLIQALSYYELGNYAMTLAKIQLLDGSFTLDLNAPNAPQLLADKLEKMSQLISKRITEKG